MLMGFIDALGPFIRGPISMPDMGQSAVCAFYLFQRSARLYVRGPIIAVVPAHRGGDYKQGATLSNVFVYRN